LVEARQHLDNAHNLHANEQAQTLQGFADTLP